MTKADDLLCLTQTPTAMIFFESFIWLRTFETLSNNFSSLLSSKKKNLFKMYFSILNSVVPKVLFLKQTKRPAAQIFHDKSTSIGLTLTFRTLWVRIERPGQPHYT